METTREELLAPGTALQCRYRRHNIRGIQQHKWELRRFIVRSVRDLRDEPLDPTTPLLEPLVDRGNLLVTGFDIDKQAERSFYVERMSELRRLDPTPRQLQPLRVLMLEGGKFSRFTERPDPREYYCREYNALDVGETAVA